MLQFIRPIFKLAWPIFVTQSIQTIMVTIDLLMSAQVSDADMAAVGTSLSIWHPAYFFCMGVIMVLAPVLSHAYGESNFKKLANYFNQGIWLAIITCIFTLIILSFSDHFLAWLNLEPKLQSIGSEYLYYLSFGLPFVCLIACFRYLNEAVGETKPLMLFSLIAMLLNIPLNWLFIYGFGDIIPAFGGAGCGIATSISTALLFVGFATITWLRPITKQALKEFNFSWPQLTDLAYLIKLGVPIGFTIFMELALFGAVALAIATHGTYPAAAHQIALNVTTNFYMVPLSLGMATTVLIGQKLGQKQFAQAKQVAQSGILMCVGFAVLSCITIMLSRSWLIPLFSDSQAIFVIAMSLLFWAAIFQMSDGIQTIVAASLRGYADTQKPMLLVLLSYWLIGFPTGYLLAETNYLVPAMGVSAYWIGLLISLSMSAILLSLRLAYFWRKPWLLNS
ncbi:MATE family efflux transporter [Catenovulum sp. 2E275]|uniref:MATE family efflux transporter n=1 Tax=Catenovulum sp. 2E275 TaxID=2980497 RepID=UPI0021D3C491|nr:MATE family efflux transporter [Catenovulum sp. 2E275]MCU4676822.1 MATE family efflux transporter [Catenovulum sp. 2E275]